VKRRVGLVAVVVLGALAAGGAAWRVLERPRPASAPPEQVAVVSLPSLTVNLRGDDGFTYLRLRVALEVAGPVADPASAVDARRSAILNAVIESTEGASFTELRTDAGRDSLARRLAARAGAILQPAHVRVRRVYFEEFVAE
jgi:flagellar basal body-associated protein FliL